MRTNQKAAARSAAWCCASKAARRSPAAPTYAPDAAARHAARQDLSFHRGARPDQVSRYQRGEENAGRISWVITSDDVRKVIPDPYYGPAFHDQPILAIDKVRFVGEPVAVVLAADPHIAEAATHAIVAEYDELPPVYDEVEAMTAPTYVDDGLKPAGSFADLKHLKGQKNTNLALNAKLRRGDVDKAFAEAAQRLRARIPHAKMPARAIRAVLLDRRLQGIGPDDL